jgi:hypothetical protein
MGHLVRPLTFLPHRMSVLTAQPIRSQPNIRPPAQLKNSRLWSILMQSHEGLDGSAV